MLFHLRDGPSGEPQHGELDGEPKLVRSPSAVLDDRKVVGGKGIIAGDLAIREVVGNPDKRRALFGGKQVRGFRGHTLALQALKLLFELLPAGEHVAHGRGNRRRTILGLVAGIHRDLFQAPAGGPCAMCPVVSQSVEGDIRDQLPFVAGGPRFELCPKM
jgi:hypothetical protein